MKKYKIRFLKTEAGKSIIWKFLKELNDKDYDKTLSSLKRLREFGSELRYPVTEKVYQGLYNLRIQTVSHWIRVFYFFSKNDIIIIINGIKKKQNKTPKNALNTAIKYMKDFINKEKKNEKFKGSQKVAKNKRT